MLFYWIVCKCPLITLSLVACSSEIHITAPLFSYFPLLWRDCVDSFIFCQQRQDKEGFRSLEDRITLIKRSSPSVFIRYEVCKWPVGWERMGVQHSAVKWAISSVLCTMLTSKCITIQSSAYSCFSPLSLSYPFTLSFILYLPLSRSHGPVFSSPITLSFHLSYVLPIFFSPTLPCYTN